jgi:hypothetical protein
MSGGRVNDNSNARLAASPGVLPLPDLQRQLFTWAAIQPAVTGLIVLMAGVVYGFFGFRLFRFLLAVTCAGLGWLVGLWLALATGFPAAAIAPAAGLGGGLLSLKWQRPAVVIALSMTWAILGYYLAIQTHVPKVMWLPTGGVTGLLGALFGCLCYKTTTVILTTLQGVTLMVLGFVAVATQIVPAVGSTFRQWANNQSLLVPVFMTMLFAAAFSYQSTHLQGDIRTGR